jgi:hypothetical protein
MRSRWWTTKVRQFRAHLGARVGATERAELVTWLSPPELAVFDAMHVADRRHGIDVVAALRVEGVTERDVLVAGLLHDAGKGSVGIWPRVFRSLGEAYGPWIWRAVGVLPGMRRDLDRLARHAETSAGIAARAGCSERTVELIRWQETPRDPEFGELLRLADNAS